MNIFKWIGTFFCSGPYLDNENRLPDILAAIQVLGTYEFAARKSDGWIKRLGGKPKSAKTWGDVFEQHSEFFTLDDKHNIALVWRRSFTRDYDTVNKEIVFDDELKKLKSEEKEPNAKARLSRKPLNQEQIEHLCNLAINLHEREIQHRQEKRWWVTVVVGIVVAMISIMK